MNITAIEIRKVVNKVLEEWADYLDRSEYRKFVVVENIQDRRPRASGPYTWDEAVKVWESCPNRYVCDFGAPLP